MKFNIIEDDRFLKLSEMEKIQGGGKIHECILPYKDCITTAYETCSVHAAPTFGRGQCGSGGEDIYTICTGGATYRFCFTLGPNYFDCIDYNSHD